MKKNLKPDKHGAIYVNIRGLFPKSNKSKVPYLADLAKQTNAPFICVTKSHLNPEIIYAEISIQGYYIFRSDRVGRSHGGVVTYARKDMVVKTELKDSNSYCDSLILHIPQKNLVLVNIYRPPNCPEILFSQTLEFTSSFFRNLEEHGQCSNTYLVVGDFNFPFLQFSDNENFIGRIKKCENCTINLLEQCSHNSSQKKQAEKLLEFSNEFFLTQYIRKPTRNRNILDLCFTNDHFLINDYQTIVNSKLSDHYTICINLNYEKIQKSDDCNKTNHYQTKVPEFDLRAGDDEDWLRLNLLLDETRWESLMEDLSAEESLKVFLNVLEEKVSTIFTKKAQFNDEKSDQPAGRFKSGNKIPREIRKLMRKKRNISKAMLKIKSLTRLLKLRENLEEIETKLQSSYEARRSEQENQAISKIKKDPKAFYGYAKKFSKTNSDIGPFFSKDGDPVTDTEEIVEMLRLQYESVFSTPMKDKQIQNPEEFFSSTEAESSLDNISFNRSDIIDKIDCLSSGAACGPDGIPAILLKKCKYSLVDGLEILFRKFLVAGDIPAMLKHAFVIPIHKGGSRGLPANFRPVSLTSHIMKTFERVVREVLVCHLEANSKLNPSQHGFRNKRSCLSQLLEYHDHVLSILEEGQNVDSIYLDFAKAFDKVDKGILCHKLRNMGICGKLGLFLHNFLTDRNQTVLANGKKSTPSLVKSGVPQGTVLGPILFLILINDIDQNIHSNVSLFADDTRIARAVSTEEDVELLQADLDQVYCWQEVNNMEFNSRKFELMRYGKNKILKESTSYFTPNWELIIEEKESLRDLGVIMSNDASFSSHVEHVCGKVRQKSGWILRTFHTRQTWFLKLLWKTLVQPHVDYCSQLYFPHLNSDMQKIENLQQTYTKKIPEVRHLNYWERLKTLKMYSQERRMERYRIIYAWKILEGISPNCGLISQTSERRGRELKIPAIRGKGRIQTLREASFQVHGARLFNSMPKSIRELTKISVDQFKYKLDVYLQAIPDEPSLHGYVPSVCNQLSGIPSNSLVDHVKSERLRRPG